MCEETLSEFIDELTKRDDPFPRDLIRKYADKGLPQSEMAAALLARSALRSPRDVSAALEASEQQVSEMVRQAYSRGGVTPPGRAGLAGGLRQALRRLFRRG
jgi:hypothetical protein